MILSFNTVELSEKSGKIAKRFSKISVGDVVSGVVVRLSQGSVLVEVRGSLYVPFTLNRGFNSSYIAIAGQEVHSRTHSLSPSFGPLVSGGELAVSP